MPTYAELHIDQGTTFNSTITLTDDTTNANLNLVNYTARSKMRRSYYSANSKTITCSITDAPNGKLTISLTSANTSALVPGRYVYDIELVDPANSVSRIMEGTAFVSPGVT
jgi:hypothetical protein